MGNDRLGEVDGALGDLFAQDCARLERHVVLTVAFLQPLRKDVIEECQLLVP